jgi:hypothetical protein
MKPRENRQKVMVKARMLSGTSWQDICILNCSAHGLGIQSATPPNRGTYVEIRRGRQTIVARVAWSKGHRAGLRSQDTIFVTALLNDQAPPSRGNGEALRERRYQPRPTAVAHAENRFLGRTMEFACVAIMGGAIALAGASAVSQALARPMSSVQAALK